MGAPPDLKMRSRPRGPALKPLPTSPSRSGSSESSPSPRNSSPAARSSQPSLPLPKAPNALSSPLPSLRVLLYPRPGLGVDMRLPLSRRTRCYMQLDSFFNGPSVIRIGVHPRNYPGVRLQLSPIPKVSMRVPLWVGGAKYLQVGACCGVGYEGGRGMEWGWFKGVAVSVGVTLELWRYSTGVGMMDERVRKGVREVLKGRDRGWDERVEEIPVDAKERERVLKALKEAVGEQRKVIERRKGIRNDSSVVGKDGKL